MKAFGATAAPVELAPPGAGIPALEVLLGKVMFAYFRTTRTPELANKHFHAEAGAMLRMARSLSPDVANTPVLIPRVMGIEDSSRNWSVLMTLDHLVIVNTGILEIIDALSGERLYNRRISIADLKPRPEQQSLETIGKFARTTQNYFNRLSQIRNLKSSARHAHPWFGPMDALGWHWLAALHNTIHRRQIQKIIATSSPEGSISNKSARLRGLGD